ncbi:MAG: RNA polymerase sigma factor [Chitinophagaceae bacterium]|nr:RNA polymerase sigma factor [Chitinophagaceae bacterium]
MPYTSKPVYKNDKDGLSNEPELLQKTANGDWEAYTMLFNHYLPKLSQYIYPLTSHSRQDTEEVIQEVFLKIWEKKESLVAIRCFDGYLFKMARNKLVDMLAGQKALQAKHRGYALLKPTSHSEPEQAVIYTEYYEAARDAIDSLSPKLKTVFLMSTEQDLALDEIASMLSLPKETVKKRLYLASSSIRSYLYSRTGLVKLMLLFIFLLKK